MFPDHIFQEGKLHRTDIHVTLTRTSVRRKVPCRFSKVPLISKKSFTFRYFSVEYHTCA